MSNNDEQEESNIKTILIGNEGVGKTNLINVSIGKAFMEKGKATLVGSFMKKEILINEKSYFLALWDTIGQERLRSLTKLYFNNSKIVIFVYDITDKKSFEGLISWEKNVKELIGDDIIKGVIGNKQDLILNEQVNEEEAIKYAKSINAKFRLTSAKMDPEGFNSFLQELLIDYINKNEFIEKNLKLENKYKLKKNKKSCC